MMIAGDVPVNRKSYLCENEDLNKYYFSMRKFVRRTSKGFFNCCFIHGKAGLGKSIQVEAELRELGLKINENKGLSVSENKGHYVVFNGEMSRAFLFRYLYEHNGKVIIFRDMEKRLNCLDSINIFRAATETHGERKVQKATYSKLERDLPESYRFSGAIIFEMNSLNFKHYLREEIESLIDSRGSYINIMFCREEIQGIMRLIARTKSQKEVTEFLIRNFKSVGWTRFDLRTQHKAFQIHKAAKSEGTNWKTELLEYLATATSRVRQMLYPYIGQKEIGSFELKKVMVKNRIDNCHTMRTADRRIRDYVLMQEMFITELGATKSEQEMENYMNTHRNYSLSLDPLMAEISDTSDIKEQEALSKEIAAFHQELAT